MREQAWQHHDNYQVIDGALIGTGRRSTYWPEEHPEIVNEFADLAQNDEDAVVRFARRWGSLGYRELVESAPNPNVAATGERLEWIWAHARVVRACMNLLLFVQSPRRRAILQAAEEELFAGSRRPRLGLQHRIVGPSGFGLDRAGIARERAEQNLVRLLASNLDGVRIVPVPSPHGDFPSEQRFRALIEVVYLQLLGLVNHGSQVAQCEYCEGLFVRTDARQRYCPRPIGARPGVESPCARRARDERRRGRPSLPHI